MTKKIAEKVHHDDGGDTLTIETIYDVEPTLKQVENLKNAGFDQQKGDNSLSSYLTDGHEVV